MEYKYSFVIVRKIESERQRGRFVCLVRNVVAAEEIEKRVHSTNQHTKKLPKKIQSRIAHRPSNQLTRLQKRLHASGKNLPDFHITSWIVLGVGKIATKLNSVLFSSMPSTTSRAVHFVFLQCTEKNYGSTHESIRFCCILDTPSFPRFSYNITMNAIDES